MSLLVLFLALSLGYSSEAFSIAKHINPCGVVYSTITPNVHGVRKVFHHMRPHIMEINHLVKSSHHRVMDEYSFENTWIPEEHNISLTSDYAYNANQLPTIYKCLQYFSYALDIILEDSLDSFSENCFIIIDTLPMVIRKHQQLICNVDSAMGQLGLDVPSMKEIKLPEDWVHRNDGSCSHKLFRFAEVHTKYRNFMRALQSLAHI